MQIFLREQKQNSCVRCVLTWLGGENNSHKISGTVLTQKAQIREEKTAVISSEINLGKQYAHTFTHVREMNATKDTIGFP